MKSTLTFALVACLSLITACATDAPQPGDKETETPTWFEDADQDGFGNSQVSMSSIDAPEGYVADDGDCDDSDELIHPGTPEIPLNGIDENCDGSDLLALYPDGDDDGYGDQTAEPVFNAIVPTGFVDNAQDCDDTNAAIHPGASEVDGNGIDDNCDGIYNDPLLTWYADDDGDGFGDPATTQQAATAPPSYVANADDCNDNDAAIHPDANELAANGIDENCDGLDLYVLYPDTDGDGYGDKNTDAILTPDLFADHVFNNLDCDDTLDTVNPDGIEQNDPYDNDCDGVANDGPFAVGDYGPAGGIVFSIGTPFSYEAAPEDQSAGAEWGCDGTTVGAERADIGTGAQNTADILAGCATADIAARLADEYSLNGYDDWFLPSILELTALYDQKTLVGGFADDLYWSSTELFTWAEGKHFGTGQQQGGGKSESRRVRAIREF